MAGAAHSACAGWTPHGAYHPHGPPALPCDRRATHHVLRCGGRRCACPPAWNGSGRCAPSTSDHPCARDGHGPHRLHAFCCGRRPGGDDHDHPGASPASWCAPSAPAHHQSRRASSQSGESSEGAVAPHHSSQGFLTDGNEYQKDEQDHGLNHGYTETGCIIT